MTHYPSFTVKSLAQWVSYLHLHGAATRQELASWVAVLEREWGIVDPTPVAEEKCTQALDNCTQPA